MEKKKRIKKNLEHFLKDETGYISKEAILKIGLGTVSALGMLSAFSSNLIAGHSNHSQHSNTIGGTSVPPCVKIAHSSHSSHGSHTSY